MRMTVAAAVACLLGVGISTAHDAQAAIKHDTTIPAQELGSALKQLANERDIQLVYLSEDVNQRQTSGAVGELTVDEALTKLLKGTGLTYQYIDDQAITIVPMDSRSASPQRSPVKSQNTGVWDRFRIAQAEQGSSSSSSSGAEAPDRRLTLEEVIVTAQKREERLIDTPQSVTVISGVDIERMGATQFRDLANAVPGMTFNTVGAGRTQINLRGVSTGTDISATVVSYIDDVPYGSTNAFNNGATAGLDLALFDLDRIEVLRGPQGTLYGSASMGGLIKYITKRPDTETFSGAARTRISQTREGGISYDAASAINAPLVSGKLAVRASAFESHDGGYIDNLTLGHEDVNRSDTYGGRLDVLYVPSETFSIRITGLLQDIHSDGQATVDYVTSGAADAHSVTQQRAYNETFDQQYRQVSGAITYDLGPATLTSISSYQTIPALTRSDSSLAFLPFTNGVLGRSYSAVGAIQQTNVYKFTQEVRLASSRATRFEWLIGGVYDRQKALKEQVLDPRDAAGQPAPNDLFSLSIPSLYKDVAAFGDITYHFTEKFDLTSGIRYAQNDQTVTQQGSGLFTGSRPTRSASDNFVTYLGNIRYHFNDRTTGYLRYATGYRPGGPNILLNNPVTGLPLADPTFDADKLKNYEAGLKAETEDNRFGAELVGYYLDWSDMQVIGFRTGPSGGGATIRTNAPGGASVRGAELAFTARTTSGFTAASSLAYTDGRLSENAPDVGGTKGERLPFAPVFAGTVQADYEFSAKDSRPSVGATLRYAGERKAAFGSAAYRMPSYTMLDLRTGTILGPVNVQLYIHNVFDERAQISQLPDVPDSGFSHIAIQQPRTVGLTASITF